MRELGGYGCISGYIFDWRCEGTQSLLLHSVFYHRSRVERPIMWEEHLAFVGAHLSEPVRHVRRIVVLGLPDRDPKRNVIFLSIFACKFMSVFVSSLGLPYWGAVPARFGRGGLRRDGGKDEEEGYRQQRRGRREEHCSHVD